MSDKRLTQCDGCGMSGQNPCRECRARFFTAGLDIDPDDDGPLASHGTTAEWAAEGP